MINYLLEEIWFMTLILTWFVINTGNKILPILNHKKRKKLDIIFQKIKF